MKKLLQNIKHEAFTLVEFIVIISIFAIMAAVALFNFTGFRNDVGLNNLAHDIALTIRQAQVFGWAASGGSAPLSIANDGTIKDPVEGVFFQATGNAASPFEQQFVLYTKAPNATIDSFDSSQGTLDTINDTIKIQGTYKISGIAVAEHDSDLLVTNHQIPTTATPVTANQGVSIAFSRPRPEALLLEDQNSVLQPNNYLGIYVAADSDPVVTGTIPADHVIIISRFGEIEVK